MPTFVTVHLEMVREAISPKNALLHPFFFGGGISITLAKIVFSRASINPCKNTFELAGTVLKYECSDSSSTNVKSSASS